MDVLSVARIYFQKNFCTFSFSTLYFVIRQRCVVCCGERVAVVLCTWRNTFLVRSMIHHTCVCSLHTMPSHYPCNLKKIRLRTKMYMQIQSSDCAKIFLYMNSRDLHIKFFTYNFTFFIY